MFCSCGFLALCHLWCHLGDETFQVKTNVTRPRKCVSLLLMIKQSLNDLSEVTLTSAKIVFLFCFPCNLDYGSGLWATCRCSSQCDELSSLVGHSGNEQWQWERSSKKSWRSIPDFTTSPPWRQSTWCTGVAAMATLPLTPRPCTTRRTPLRTCWPRLTASQVSVEGQGAPSCQRHCLLNACVQAHLQKGILTSFVLT